MTSPSPDNLPSLPQVNAIDAWMVDAIRKSQPTNGLAILIGCTKSVKHKPLQGVVKDLVELSNTFKQLMFTTLCLNDPTVEHIKEIIRLTAQLDVSYLRMPPTWQRIVVTFSGHGDSKYLYTKNGRIDLPNDLVRPLQVDKAEQLAYLAKMFFIDACRGDNVERGVDISWLNDNRSSNIVARGGRVPGRGNCYIVYSTLLGMKSFELPRNGGLWIQLLSRELLSPKNRDNIIQGVVTEVNRKLIKTCNDNNIDVQQPVDESTLWDQVKLLKEAEDLRMKQQQFVSSGQQQQQQQQQQLAQPLYQQQQMGYQQAYSQRQQNEIEAGGYLQQQFSPQQQQGACLPPQQQQGAYPPPQQQQGACLPPQQPQGLQQGLYLPPPQQQQGVYLQQHQDVCQMQGVQSEQQAMYWEENQGVYAEPQQQQQQQPLLQQQPFHQQLPQQQPLQQQPITHQLQQHGGGYPSQPELPALPLTELDSLLSYSVEDRGRHGSHSNVKKTVQQQSKEPVLLKKKSAKNRLEDYFGKSSNILYETKPEADRYRSKVFCPELGYAIGEVRPTEERAEESAAKKALNELLKCDKEGTS